LSSPRSAELASRRLEREAGLEPVTPTLAIKEGVSDRVRIWEGSRGLQPTLISQIVTRMRRRLMVVPSKLGFAAGAAAEVSEGLSRSPVLPREAGDPPELRGLRCYEGGAAPERLAADEDVVGTDGGAGRLQSSADPSGHLCVVVTEVEDADGPARNAASRSAWFQVVRS